MRGAVIECINVSTEKSRSFIIIVILCRLVRRNYQTKRGVIHSFPVDNSSFVGDNWNYSANLSLKLSREISEILPAYLHFFYIFILFITF